jgi:hypothetical protein
MAKSPPTQRWPRGVSEGRPEGFDTLITDLVLAWAEFDASLLYLVIVAYNIRDDVARILLGNMDFRTRVERVKTLADRCGAEDLKKAMATINKEMPHFLQARNTVCHNHYVGHFPDRFLGKHLQLVFGPSAAAREMENSANPVLTDEYLKDSAAYALRASATLDELARDLRATPLQLPE